MLTATATTTPDAGGLLIDSLLRRQREPTAVERFARHHDEGHDGVAPPAMERYYRDLGYRDVRVVVDRPSDKRVREARALLG